MINTKDQIIKIIKEVLKIDEVQLEQNIVDDLHMDSLDIVEMIVLIEDAFDIEITDGSIPKMITVKDVIDIVEEIIKNENN